MEEVKAVTVLSQVSTSSNKILSEKGVKNHPDPENTEMESPAPEKPLTLMGKAMSIINVMKVL